MIYQNQFLPFNLRKTICKEVFLTVPEVIFTIKDFFLLDELNKKIQMLEASGLIEFWGYKYIDKKHLNLKQSNEPKVLTMNNFKGCFGVLMFGAATSFVSFVFESFAFKFQRFSGNFN